MRLKSLKKTSGLAALAMGLAALAMPSLASADPGDGRGGNYRGSHENRGGGEGRGGGENRGGWGQRQAQAPQQQAQPQPQPQPRAQARGDGPRNWGGDRNGDAPGRGWRGDNPARQNVERGPLGLDWSQARRAPEAAPQPRAAPRDEARRGDWQRNRDYSAQERNRTYSAPRQQGWDGQRWQGQNGDRNRVETRRWDGDRDGRRWDGNRDGRRWDGNRSGSWSRDWRRDNRYNWQSYRTTHRHVYNLGRYSSPYRDWSYRRLSIGFFLQPLFFRQNYWIDDPWSYRLPEPWGPYRWVRYYDDALLVDVYSGEVVDVLYDVFW